MAYTKLTLRIDEEVIAGGKRLAKRRGTSLSKMVEEYLKSRVKAGDIDATIVASSELDRLFTANHDLPARYDDDEALRASYIDNVTR